MLSGSALSEGLEVLPQFSPDGRWVAYQTNESGRFEIVVQPPRRMLGPEFDMCRRWIPFIQSDGEPWLPVSG